MMTNERILLIANPAAQRGNGEAAADVAAQLLRERLAADGGTLTCQLTERPHHATELAAQATRDDYDVVIALGGDGVVHEAVNGLMQLPFEQRPAFGLIPVGSGNDYARTLGISEKIPEAVAQLFGATRRLHDVGVCNGEYFVETLSFGLDAAIALDTVERRKRTGQQGTMLYLTSGLDQLLHHLDIFHASAILDGERAIESDVHLLTVQIGQTYGGGFRICPEADPADGVFDICYADAPMSVPEATFKFLRAKDAHHTKFKNIHFDRASAIELHFDRRPPCQIDGEAHVADAYSISMVPSALNVLVAGK